MSQNPKYDNDIVNLGYLNKRLGQTEESINKNNSSISQIPKNYSTPPNPPYYKDSLLCYGNKIYRCNKTKMNGNFSWNDWTVVATDDTTISDFIKNTYEVEKLKIQEQIDGKIQTHYQDNDPSKDWTTDLDKGRHVGDYWYNTTNDTQWRYNQITTTSPITYAWGQVNIPKAVFDTIDTKKSIYTEKPSSYNKDDLWIIEETLSDEDLPVGTEENPIVKGDWVFSTNDSETFDKSHWVKRDEDISMTYINQHYYTIGEIDSTLEEIERNTDSKITKAKDEISLSVSQTYTTKEEHKATIYDFNEQIGTINQTITNHKETLSDLSIEVGKITSTVESIETTTKKLETNIDSVSADFEDFKDNEYIQSIDNLQKQIDGAIQFWNGAEIPTLDNYPANQWTTENDRINHQADIYTVVEDIDGEMKQGKSYRFDKIDGVWQWIELTDNELSAVQAIAQEALDKAKANATEIGTVKTRVSSLEQTDEQIKASVESIDKQIIPTATATGSNINLEDASNNPLTYLEIEGKSTQETRSGINRFKAQGLSTPSSDTDFWNVTPNTTIYTQKEDGWANINQSNLTTTNTYYNIAMKSSALDIKPSTQYTYIIEFDNVTKNTSTDNISRLALTQDGGGLFTSSRSIQLSSIESGRKYKFLFTTIDDLSTESLFYMYLNLYNNSISFDLRVMIVEGDYTNSDIEYEPYGVSPSPDYPSEIESVGYENLFDVTLDSSITNEIQYKTYILEPNAKYTISTNTYLSNDVVANIFIDLGTSLTPSTLANGVNGSKTITTDSTGYVTIGYRNYYMQLDYSTGMYYCQLEKGSVVHSYIPYGKYGIEVETVGKNLINISKYNANNYISQLLTSKAGTYTVHYTGEVSSAIYIRKADNVTPINGTVVAEGYNRNIFTFTISELGMYYIQFYKSGTGFTSFSNAMLNKGTVVLDYKPFQKNTSLIVLNAPLRSLPNGVNDIAYIKNDKLYVDRYVGSVVLDGSENWYKTNDTVISGFNLTNTIQVSSYGRNGIGLSNFFKYSYANSVGNMYYSNTTTITLCMENTYTLETFKTWLSTHNTQVDYELATPVTEELGEIEMLKTLKGYNDILTTDELLPIINLTYVRDTIIADYVENHVTELKLTESEIKASVESVSSSVDGLNTSINRVEEITNDNSQVINIISTNIDKTSGEVREVTTTTGFTFNADGMTIDDGSGFRAEHTAKGTYYKDGNSIVGQYTKDGSKQKDLELFGTYSYGKKSIDDTPMFVGQLYNDENGEECFGHFYNGGDY